MSGGVKTRGGGISTVFNVNIRGRKCLTSKVMETGSLALMLTLTVAAPYLLRPSVSGGAATFSDDLTAERRSVERRSAL